MVGAPARRRQVVFAQRHGLSQRRACALFSVSRSTLGYASRIEARDGPLLAAMKQLSDQFPRFGYRRILVFMEQLGHAMGPDKALRLWQKAGLQVPRKRPRKRVAHSRPRPQLPSGANEVWAYDFVHDACANGQQLKCLTIIDEYTRECLAIDVAGSIRSNRVIEILSRLVSERGAPHHLRSDNGPEWLCMIGDRDSNRHGWTVLPLPEEGQTDRSKSEIFLIYYFLKFEYIRLLYLAVGPKGAESPFGTKLESREVRQGPKPPGKINETGRAIVRFRLFASFDIRVTATVQQR
jgi:hypothetical protein